MTRRNIILISVLVNAGLLALLFLTAVKTEYEESSNQQIVQQPNVPRESIIPHSQMNAYDVTSSSMDEVDNVLKEYLPELPVESMLAQEEIPMEEIPAEVVAYKANPSQNIVEVVVKRGDALEKIARANHTTIDSIRQLNRLSTDKLIIGQVLKVPVGTVKLKTPEVAKIKTPQNQNIATGDPQFYIVKTGDNPWKIAKQNNVKFDDLLKLNQLNEESAKNLKIGDKIRVK